MSVLLNIGGNSFKYTHYDNNAKIHQSKEIKRTKTLNCLRTNQRRATEDVRFVCFIEDTTAAAGS